MVDEQKDPAAEQTAGTEPESREVEEKLETEVEYRDLQPGELKVKLEAHHEWVPTAGAGKVALVHEPDR